MPIINIHITILFLLSPTTTITLLLLPVLAPLHSLPLIIIFILALTVRNAILDRLLRIHEFLDPLIMPFISIVTGFFAGALSASALSAMGRLGQ
jgi:hypothetical protein